MSGSEPGFRIYFCCSVVRLNENLIIFCKNERFNPMDGYEKRGNNRKGYFLFFGAGSRGRTDTVLLPSDFESDASANSTIPAYGAIIGRR